MSLSVAGAPVIDSRLIVEDDGRPMRTLVADIVQSGLYNVDRRIIQYARRYTEPWRDEHDRYEFVLIRAEDLEKPTNISHVLGRAMELKYQRPSTTMAFRFAKKYPPGDLGLTKLIICCKPLAISRENRPDKKRRHLLAMSRAFGINDLGLSRFHTPEHIYSTSCVFAFVRPVS